MFYTWCTHGYMYIFSDKKKKSLDPLSRNKKALLGNTTVAVREMFAKVWNLLKTVYFSLSSSEIGVYMFEYVIC